MSAEGRGRKTTRLEVDVAGESGFCFGVRRAVRLAMKASHRAGRPVHSLGPLMHNPQEVSRLEDEGIRVARSTSGLRRGVVIVRSHGVEPRVLERLRSRGLTVVDATCPFVRKAQKLALKLVDSGYSVILVGDREHPEVRSIVAYAGGKVSVVEGPGDLDALRLTRRIGILSQTTQPVENLARVVAWAVERADEVKVYNTVCLATVRRQDEARRMARKADLVLVVGGRASANTKRLVEICREEGAETHHIESARELKAGWLAGKHRAAIIGGASTPRWIIDGVRDRVFSFTRPGCRARIPNTFGKGDRTWNRSKARMRHSPGTSSKRRSRPKNSKRETSLRKR